jgi:hypothetical protein
VLGNVSAKNGLLCWSETMAKKVNKWYACKCEWTAPYTCSYCVNRKRAPKWVSIIWKGKMVDIGPGGKIRKSKKENV